MPLGDLARDPREPAVQACHIQQHSHGALLPTSARREANCEPSGGVRADGPVAKLLGKNPDSTGFTRALGKNSARTSGREALVHVLTTGPVVVIVVRSALAPLDDRERSVLDPSSALAIAARRFPLELRVTEFEVNPACR